MAQLPFTVVGYRLDTGESFVHRVTASDTNGAIQATERDLLGGDPPAWEVCAVIAGHHRDLR